MFIPSKGQQDVLISEHFTFNGEMTEKSSGFTNTYDGQLKVVVPRSKWNAIADQVHVEFNKRLKAYGIKSGRWKTGVVPVSRLLGKELVLLAWAIEDTDVSTLPTAIRNWLGLAQEERWWLYSMTNAATGHAVSDRGKGWRKAVQYALTENPVFDSQRSFEQHPSTAPAAKQKKYWRTEAKAAA